MKGKKRPSETIEEDIRSQLIGTSTVEIGTIGSQQLLSNDEFDDDDEHTAIILPQARKQFNSRLAEQQKKVGCLIVLAGEETGRVLQIGELGVVLGRGAETDFELKGHGISRVHAKIECSLAGVHYAIEDAGSRNGTFVNGKVAQAPTTLKDGDLITLGGAFLLKFKKIEKSYLSTRDRNRVKTLEGGVIQVSDDQRVTFINKTAKQLLGIGTNATPEQSYAAALKQRVIKIPSDFQKQDNVEVWQAQIGNAVYRCHSTPIYSDPITSPQKIIGVANLLLDASLESMLEREINLVSQQLLVASQRANAARQIAESANRSKSEFLARMSHELRTPLNAIIGYAELLLEESELLSPEELDGDLGKIRTAGRHLLNLIDEVLDISRLEAGKVELNLELFLVEELVDTLYDLTLPLAQKNGNKLIFEKSDDLAKLLSDQLKAKQIIYNILSNACKFTHQGKIRLRVKRTKHAGQEWYKFSITDTGIGMSKEQINKIFEAFYQAESSSTRKYEGTGLGLTISKKFCDLLGGKMHAKSTPNKGTTFIVLLPLQFPTPI